MRKNIKSYSEFIGESTKEVVYPTNFKGMAQSALAGVYFFAAVHEGKLYLASLGVKDSVRRSLQCPP